jgi:hypothetical protein
MIDRPIFQKNYWRLQNVEIVLIYFMLEQFLFLFLWIRRLYVGQIMHNCY